ncbi:probable DNA double-strand break repair Rad50 ATPase [Centruroides vittatus]|uniref:probable DNA double-strand break repair Rad50 ATPase n=1 Tax=Centruroides vittatus TaxID=120091 RepID=UPI00350F0CC3
MQSLEETLNEEVESNASEIITISESKTSSKCKSASSVTEISTYSVETHKKLERSISDLKTVSSDTYCKGNRWMVGNMWKTMNFSKRIDAIEQGMDKVVTALNNYSRSIDKQRKDFERKKNEDNNIVRVIEENFESLMNSLNLAEARLEMVVFKEEYLTIKNDHQNKLDEQSTKLETLRLVTEKLRNIVDGDRKVWDLFEVTDSLEERLKFVEENTGLSHEVERSYDLSTLGNKFDEFVDKVQPMIDRLQKEEELDQEMEDANIAEQLMNVRLNMKQCFKDSKLLKDEIEVLKVDVETLGKTTEMLVKANETGFNEEDKVEFYDMQKRLKILEKDCEQLEHLDEIQSAIAVISNNKANNSEVENALAQKADLQTVKNKIDKDEYLTTYEGLNNNIAEMMAKITLQEQNLLKNVATLTTELDHKVEKIELENMTEVLQSRLKAVAIRLKHLQYIVECEAPIPAGIKSSFAKCISCERPVRKNPNILLKRTPEGMNRPITNLQSPQNVFLDEIYVPTNECEHTGRYVGGEHTTGTINKELQTSFPKIS